MTVRTLFAGLAAAYFLLIALAFLAPGAAVYEDYTESGVSAEIDGEEGAAAVTVGVRVLAGGLVLVSLALVEWGAIAARYRESEAKAAAERG